MPNKITKANGHIVQADWNQTDPLKMDYIHNKPELPEHVASEEFVSEAVGAIKSGTQVTVKGEMVETFNADTKLSIPSNTPSYSVIPMIDNKGSKDIAYLDYALGSVASVGTNKALATYTTSGGSRNVGARHLWTATPTQNLQCANKQYVDNAKQSAVDLIDYARVKQTTKDLVSVNETISWESLSPSYGDDTSLWPVVSSSEVFVESFDGGSGWEGYTSTAAYERVVELPIYLNEPMEVTFRLNEAASLPSTTWVGDYLNTYYPGTVDELLYGQGSDIYDEQDVYPLQHGTYYAKEYGGHELIAITSDYESNYDMYSNGGKAHYLGEVTDNSEQDGMTDEVTLTGTRFYLHIIEANSGVLVDDFDEFCSRYYLPIDYSILGYPQNEDDPYGYSPIATPEHAINLYSKKEVHYTYPVTRLEIYDFIESYDSEYAQQWVVSFVAGDSDPIVIIPDNVLWAGSEPYFSEGNKYHLVFKKLGDHYVGFCTEIIMPYEEGGY